MEHAIGLGLILTLRDRASAGLDAVRGKLTALRDVSQDMMRRFDEGAKQLVAGIASMAAGVKMFGLLGGLFGVSVDTAAEFEQAMARVGAVSGAVGEDFERLSKQARDLGRETQFSATQAAASQENLARAGFKTNEIINAMPGLLNMAAAEGMDLANAADIASSAIRGFGLDASEANRVADVLAKTSSASNTSIALLGESLKYVAPLAKGLGFSIEQTNAMLGVMANAGIKGSQAGTSLKSAFQRLSEEPKRVAKALDSLGVKAKTSTGDLRPLPELMKDIAAKTQGMGKGDKIGILSKIFGGVASSGMLAIMDAVANGSLPELEKALYSCSGAAKEMAERMNATAKGAMLRLESASEGLKIVIGNHLLPVYTWLIDKMAQFKSWLTQLIEAHPVISKAVIYFTTALIGLSGAALIVVGALMSISGLMKMWPLLKVLAVSALSNIRAQARLALASFTKLSVPIVGLVALAGVLFYAWRKNLWGIRDMVTAVAEGFKMALSASADGIAEVDDELISKLKAAGVWDFAVTMGKVFFRVRMFWNGLVDGLKEGWNFILDIFDGIKDFFSPIVESGQQLLKFLGILKPATKTQVDTWKSWGQLFGRLAPAIIAVIGAFKGFKVITGIVGTLGSAITGMFSLIMAHPVVAAITALIALGVYLYNNWEKISEEIGGYAAWVKGKWQGFLDWWNSWSLADVFNALIDKAAKVIEKIKKPFIEFYDWITDKFSKLNPFNWELPSWLGGGEPAPASEVEVGKQAIVQQHGTLDFTPSYMRAAPVVSVKPPEVPAVKVPPAPPAAAQAPIVNVPPAVQTTTVTPSIPEPPAVNVLPAAQAVIITPPAPQPQPVSVLPATQAVTVNPQTVQPPVVEVAAPSPAVITPPAAPITPVLKSPIVIPEQQDNPVLINAVTDIERRLGGLVGGDIVPRALAPQSQAPSSPLLIQHSQNQANMTGQATVQAQAQAPERPVKVENEVNVKVESKPVELVLDGERIGSFTLRWLERQSVRSGVG